MEHSSILVLVVMAMVAYCSAASIRQEDETPCFAAIQWSNGYDLPQCDKEGFYKALQIDSYGYSCSTKYGIVIDHSYFNPLFAALTGPCKRLKRCVKMNQARGSKEHKLIRCDKYGYFKALQRTQSGKICVDVYGNFRRTTGVIGIRDCEAVNIVSAL